MMLLYALTSLGISVLFFVYKNLSMLSEKNTLERDNEFKQIIKETAIVASISGGVTYFLNEYFYKDFASKIFGSTTNGNVTPTEIFTDKPGF